MAKEKKPKAEKPKTTEEKSEEVEEVKPEETQGAKELPGVPNDITEEEAKEADKRAEEAPKFKNVGKDMKIN